MRFWSTPGTAPGLSCARAAPPRRRTPNRALVSIRRTPHPATRRRGLYSVAPKTPSVAGKCGLHLELDLARPFAGGLLRHVADLRLAQEPSDLQSQHVDRRRRVVLAAEALQVLALGLQDGRVLLEDLRRDRVQQQLDDPAREAGAER